MKKTKNNECDLQISLRDNKQKKEICPICLNKRGYRTYDGDYMGCHRCNKNWENYDFASVYGIIP